MGAGSPHAATSMLTAASCTTLEADEVHVWVVNVAQPSLEPGKLAQERRGALPGLDSSRGDEAISMSTSVDDR